MICPNCGSDYRDGFTRCASCDVALVAPAPSSPPDAHDESLVKIYECSNPAIIPVFESLLQDADIEYLAKGENIQELFGWGRFGTGMNFVLGRPVEFWVADSDAEVALEIAAGMDAPLSPDDPVNAQ
jgi:hypothetical protein